MRKEITARKKANRISEAALNKKADGIIILDMRAVSNITDYFVICGAPSTRRVRAVAEGIEEDLAGDGIKHWHIEGKEEALWVLLDYGDVIAHVFQEELRGFYNLERLWQDAPKERISASCASPKSKQA